MPGTGCWTPQRTLAHGGHTGQHWDWWAHLSEEVRVRRVREVLVGDVGKLGNALSPGYKQFSLCVNHGLNIALYQALFSY